MLSQLKQKFLQEIEQANDPETLEEIYRCYLGRKGELTKVLRSLKDLSETERRKIGKLANQTKAEMEEILQKAKNQRLEQKHSQESKEWIDVTAPGVLHPEGHLHPLTLVRQELEEIFQSMGFFVADGPEAETEHYNFDALNVPRDHPARDLWDTIWLKDVNLLLRTHTSPVQARYMEKHKPPLRIIAPGRCFRYEATDAHHEHTFHQIECLMVDKNISVANLKGILEVLLSAVFGGQEVEIRLRPSYFPFVEPGFETDVRKKGQDWLELGGSGMVHPNVFKAVGYKKKYRGFAFGFGLERLIMIKHKIDEIRHFHSSDLRFLKQF